MATLKQRLYHTMPDGDLDTTISIHALRAAEGLRAVGLVTDTQIETAFSLTPSEWAQLRSIATSVGKEVMVDVVTLRQERYLTPAQADALLGL